MFTFFFSFTKGDKKYIAFLRFARFSSAMAKVSETINPVKVVPLSVGTGNESVNTGPPSGSPRHMSRQKSLVTRKHASVLQMTKAEFEAFKEKYGGDNGKLDKYQLEKAAKHLNKVIGNEVFSISGDEATLKLAQAVMQRRSNRSGYCKCLYFLVILCMYLIILSMQSGGELAFEQYSSLQASINDQVPLVIQEKQDVYKWLGAKVVNRVFADPPCGDGECEYKGNDFPAVDRFGCSNDCGLFNRTTNVLFNITGEFDEKGINMMGFNICPKGAKDTGRCVFQKYMNPVEAKQVISSNNVQSTTWNGKQVPLARWGWDGDPYAFFEDNFSVPLIDGEYVIRFENNRGQGGLGVTASYNYTRVIVGYQLSWAKVLKCAEHFDDRTNRSSPSRRLSAVPTVSASTPGKTSTYNIPSTTPWNDPCAAFINNTSSLANRTVANLTWCYQYCIRDEDSCLRFTTKTDVVLMYPTLQKACQEFNVLSKFPRTRACTMSSLRSGFRKLSLLALLETAEIQHAQNVEKAPMVSTEDQEKYFFQFSLEGLEKTLTDMGCKSVLPLGRKDFFVRKYPSSFNVSDFAEKVLVVSPRCEDVSTLCKSENGAWDVATRRCICKRNRYGPKCDSVCPVANGVTCNGRGTCDEFMKICRCKVGYAPPYCKDTFKCIEDGDCGGTEAVQAPNADCNTFPATGGICLHEGECLGPYSHEDQLWENDRSKYWNYLESKVGSSQPLCTDGLCRACFPGWAGENCEYGGGSPSTLCTAEVNNGNAFHCNGFCLCKEGRYGLSCEHAVSASSGTDSSSTTKRGECNTTVGQCECSAEYSGVKCSFPVCGPKTCKGCYDKTSCQTNTPSCIWNFIKNECDTMPDATQGSSGDDSLSPSPSAIGQSSNDCTVDADCEENEACDPGTGKCVASPPLKSGGTACTTGTECQSGTCESGKCKPGSLSPSPSAIDESSNDCTGDADCEENETCDPSTGECVASPPLKSDGTACTTGTECQSGTCESGKCKPGRRRRRTLLQATQSSVTGMSTTTIKKYSTCGTHPDHSKTFTDYLEINFTLNRFSDLKPEEQTPFPPTNTSLDRFFGGNNVIIAGILIDQERYQVQECVVPTKSLFGDLSKSVVENRRSVYAKKCVGGGDKEPYGADGVFIPGSAIYDQSVANSKRFTNQLYPEGASGNAKVASQVFSDGGKPFAFHSDTSGRYPVFMDINIDSARAQNIIKYIQSGYFIDFQTKSVEVKFMTYNGNTGFFGLVHITFGFQPDGKVAVSEKIRIVDVNTYNNTSEVGFRFFLELIFILAMIFESIWEFAELVQARLHRGSFLLYFKSLWNYIDVVTIIMQFVQIGMWIDLNAHYTINFAPQRRYAVYESLTSNARYLYTGKNMSSLASSPGLEMLRTEMETLETIANLRENIRRFSVLCIVLNVLRMLKLLDFQPRLGLVTQTIERAKNDLLHFVLVFALINTVYAVCGVVIFGEISASFSTISKSMETVILLFMQGNIETIHYEMRESSMENVWQFYFFSFVLINVFIMLNILLAILVDAYIEVRSAASFSPGIVEELVSLAQSSIRSKESMSDKDLGVMIEKMAWSNHRENKPVASTVEKKKGICGKIVTKKAMALPVSILDETTEEAIRHVPVVKSEGSRPIEYQMDTTFLDRLLRNGLKGIVPHDDEEAIIQRMKTALLTRYGKDGTVSGEEVDIRTDRILELLQMEEECNDFSVPTS